MKAREIVDGVYWMGAVDWDRRLFDSLIPLPDGTSYNAYLIQGSDKTVLVDSVDPAKDDTLRTQIKDVPQVDYVIAHHAEQDEDRREGEPGGDEEGGALSGTPRLGHAETAGGLCRDECCGG